MLRKLLTFTLPALLGVLAVIAAGTEAWVRMRWDARRGTPGFFLADAARGQKLAPNYRGWFAGAPVYVNNLGLRADRDYSLEKGPNAFRILVLGDSVTFGHGSIYEHTYLRLLEQRLEAWHPDVEWQVWNAAVPGYNTSQELATLLDLGPIDKPDLVIVGFFPNDVTDNWRVRTPGPADRILSRVKGWAQTHVRSLELYKRLYLTAAYRVSASEGYRRWLEHLPTEELLLSNPGQIADLREQQLTDASRRSDAEVAAARCVKGQEPNPDLVRQLESDRGWPRWIDAVRELQSVDRTGTYRIVFFLNMAPDVCPDGDLFYDGGSRMLNELFLRELSQGTRAISSYDEFLHYRPSEMPLAQGHALGNSNRVKTDVLFAFLRDEVLVAAAPKGSSDIHRH